MRGLIVDNFAGGGGASTGIEMAIGRSVDIAINHDPDAIAMHTANHPKTLHYCESVFDVDPVQATAGRLVDLCWLSPDCKHFSKAKGGKPVNKEIRGLAWIGIRWALLVRPKVMYLENVEEFQTWGPLVTDSNGNAYPCKDRKGETFKAFVAMLTTGIAEDSPALKECCEVLGIDDPAPLIKGLGYKVDWQERRACNSGAATIRKRLYMVMRCDGRPIIFPKPTHGHAKSPEVLKGLLKPYKVAADIINWSLPCPSIFDRPKELVIATNKRLAKGVQRYVINTDEPFIVEKQFTPFITEHANASNQRNMPADEPLRTICAQVKGGHFAVVAPVIARQFGNSVGHDVNEPLGTITAGGGGKSQIVAACLAKHYGGNYTGAGADLRDPLPTITTVDHNAVVAASMVKLRGTNIGAPVDEPLHTISAGGQHHAVAAAFMTKYRTGSVGYPLTEPVHTITAGGEQKRLGTANTQALVASTIVKYFGTNVGQSVGEPLQTITTKHRFAKADTDIQALPLTEEQRYNAWWCARFIDMYGENIPDYEFIGYRPSMLHVAGGHIITDFGMRMLVPRELFDATAFPENYVIDVDHKGKKIPIAKQVARVGNAVSPLEAYALVMANQPELCTSKQEQAA
jgi:DNA (cytosine-5)-methyltransferase 1